MGWEAGFTREDRAFLHEEEGELLISRGREDFSDWIDQSCEQPPPTQSQLVCTVSQVLWIGWSRGAAQRPARRILYGMVWIHSCE